MMSRVTQASVGSVMLLLEARHLHRGPMSLRSSLCMVRVFCTAPFSFAMKVLSMMVSSLYQRTEGGGSPPVATHWMVRGSPSLKGPTATESDSCLPRSPRMRGREGGTDKIYIKHICKGELNNKRGAVKNDKQVFFATSLKVYLLNSACYRSCALGMKNNVAFVFLPICLWNYVPITSSLTLWYMVGDSV